MTKRRTWRDREKEGKRRDMRESRGGEKRARGEREKRERCVEVEMEAGRVSGRNDKGDSFKEKEKANREQQRGREKSRDRNRQKQRERESQKVT